MVADSDVRSQEVPRWLHLWALLTVCATLPLLLLGAEVTTKQVGMVDPVGFREPWHLLKVPLRELGLGFVIEHSHRLAGFIVGVCVIVLAASLWFRDPRRWVRFLGFAALAGVSVQGLLGGFRVNLNAIMGTNLALIHGCFAQLVFALLVSLALFTSRGWIQESGTEEAASLKRWCVLTAALVYFQIVLGAVVRHKDFVLGARAHMLVAFAVLAAVVWLVKLVLEYHGDERWRTRPAWLLAGLLVVQLLLGVEAWMSRFGLAQWHQTQPLTDQTDVVRTLHFFTGSLLFAGTVVVALQAHRRVAWQAQTEPAPVRQLEGVA